MKAIVLVTWAAAAILLPVGGVRSGTMAAGAARSPSALPRCSNIQLTIRSGQSQGAAGHIAVIYRLHNMWNQPCTLFGYPGLQLLDRNFHSLPTHLHRGAGGIIGGFPARLVRVGPYGNAYFALGYSDVEINNQPCRQVSYLMIIPPNDYLPVVTYATSHGQAILACSGNIDITPVSAHPRYR
jgi:Protein of unknown function (DUF4232)